jgi:formyltetrahydrofolate hydrolase
MNSAATDDHRPTFILTIACGDRVGIVAAVSGHLASIDGFILDSQQYADLDAGRFFMRVEFKGAGPRFPGVWMHCGSASSPWGRPSRWTGS